MGGGEFEKSYRSGDTPWDSGIPSAELVRVLDAGLLPGRPVLEIGCGTGTNAIAFARRGYRVTAVDYVDLAVQRARENARRAGVEIDFRIGDATRMDLGGPYDVVFDRGVYHGIRTRELSAFLKLLERVTRSGTRWLCLAGNAKEPMVNGPPVVSEREFRTELEPMFKILEVREFRFTARPRRLPAPGLVHLDGTAVIEPHAARGTFNGDAVIGGPMRLLTGPGRPKRFFDRLAARYDRINARIYQCGWLDRVRSAIRGERVLDVGVGMGFTTNHLAGAVGIDLSREMLRRARYRGHLVQADFTGPPFRGTRFDTIVFAGSLYYLPSAAEGLRIAAELLGQGGRVVILSPATLLLSPFVPIFTEQDYREFMVRAGLRLLSYERLNWAVCLVIGEKPSSPACESDTAFRPCRSDTSPASSPGGA